MFAHGADHLRVAGVGDSCPPKFAMTLDHQLVDGWQL
jgi:hypothetical protein